LVATVIGCGVNVLPSSTSAIEEAVAVAVPGVSLIVTVAVRVPFSAKAWVPTTVNVPPLPVTVPALDVVPSPQLIVAVNSLAVAAELLLVKVAPVAVVDWPSVAANVLAWAVSVLGSLTVAVLSTVPTTAFVDVLVDSETTTATVKLPTLV
jgi:hypothetical protein